MFVWIYIVLKKQQNSRLIFEPREGEGSTIYVLNVKCKLMLASLCIWDSISNIQAYSQISFLTSNTIFTSESGEIFEISDI